MSQSDDATGIICTSIVQESPCDATETLGSTKNLHFAFLYDSFMPPLDSSKEIQTSRDTLTSTGDPQMV